MRVEWERKKNDNVNLQHNSFYDPLASNKNVFVCLLHVCKGNEAQGLNPITSGEYEITLILPCSKVLTFQKNIYDHLHCTVYLQVARSMEHISLPKLLHIVSMQNHKRRTMFTMGEHMVDGECLQYFLIYINVTLRACS